MKRFEFPLNCPLRATTGRWYRCVPANLSSTRSWIFCLCASFSAASTATTETARRGDRRRFTPSTQPPSMCAFRFFHRLGFARPRGGQAAYAAGSSGQHPRVHPYHRWQVPLRQRSGPADSNPRRVLHHGPPLYGLRAPVSHLRGGRLPRHPGQEQPSVTAAILEHRRQEHWPSSRPDVGINRAGRRKRLPRAV